MNEISITENRAETCCPNECERDKDVIVVRTIRNENHVSMRGSFMGPSSPVYNATKAGEQDVPIQVARFVKERLEEENK